MVPKIPLFKIFWDEDDVEAVEKVIRRGSYWAIGPEISEFEQTVAEYVGRKYAVAFNSGTSALHSSILSYGITSGEVIVPSFSFISTATVVMLAGAKPVFAEIEDKSYGLDPEDVKEKINDKTKAILPMHYGGGCCGSIRALREIADDHLIPLIEDAAESLGAKHEKKMIGSVGDSAMYSFCQNKVITTGEGGIIVTDSDEIREKLKLIRCYGRVEGKKDYFSSLKDADYIMLGYNYRMPTMAAALGISQMKKISTIISKRRDIAEKYTKKLSDVPEIKTPTMFKDDFHIYQLYTIQAPKEDRDALQKHLEEINISTKVYFEPIHLKTLFKEKFGYAPGTLQTTEEISAKVLSLPIYPSLKDEEIDYVTEAVRDYFN